VSKAVILVCLYFHVIADGIIFMFWHLICMTNLGYIYNTWSTFSFDSSLLALVLGLNVLVFNIWLPHCASSIYC